MSNTITAYFKGRVGVAESVYQNDYGIVMAFDSIDLPAHFDCYFSVPGSDTATAAVGADNRVVIPNSVLGNSGNMSVHIPLHTGSNDSEVEYIAYFKVIGRARPEDDGTPAQMTAIEQALALLQNPITNIEEIVNEALSFTGDTFAEMKQELQDDFDNYTETLEGDLATWKGGVESDIDDVETDFAVLQGQFDTAVAAVTTDTEVTDIRVGADGVTDTTAGAAVRRQFDNVKGAVKLSALDEDRVHLNSLANWARGDTWNDGYFDKNIKYRVSAVSSMVFSEATKITIASGFHAKFYYFSGSTCTGHSDWLAYSITIQANQEFRACVRRATEVSSEVADVSEFAAALTTQSKVGKLGIATSNLINLLNVGEKVTPTFESGYFISRLSGLESADANYSCTDYLPVISGMFCSIVSRCFDDTSGYAFYNDSHMFMEGGSLYSSQGLDTFKIYVPANAKYVRFSCVTNQTASASMEVTDVSGSITRLAQSAGSVKSLCWNAEVQPPYFLVHIDCARKYISVANMKAIIDACADANVNQLQLHFSEDSGFRLELDDMVVSANGTSYDLTPCLGGNEASTSWLSQSDMDTIISYAHGKNIDIVPSFDMPGHMGRILWKFPSFKYNDTNTLDITNQSAINFAIALLDKYAKYFTSRGCMFFNVGYDEIVSSTGFETFYEAGEYNLVADFANLLIKTVEDNGMTARIFNEVVYYENDYNYYINKKVQIYLWYAPSPCANSVDLQTMGYQLINTRHSWYWVLGKPEMQVTEETLRSANIMRGFHSAVTPHNGYGGMFCVWCDRAASESDAGDGGANLVTQITPLIEAWGEAIENALSM